jgi:hypothetical protein
MGYTDNGPHCRLHADPSAASVDRAADWISMQDDVERAQDRTGVGQCRPDYLTEHRTRNGADIEKADAVYYVTNGQARRDSIRIARQRQGDRGGEHGAGRNVMVLQYEQIGGANAPNAVSNDVEPSRATRHLRL